MADRIYADVLGTYVSGYTRDWTSKDGSKSGSSGVGFVLRDGRNAPDKIDMPAELVPQLVQGGRYLFTVLIKGRVLVTESGAVAVLDLWAKSAEPLSLPAPAVA